MAADIRLSTTFFAHPKVKRLAKRLGNDAVVALLRLWCWVADNKPRGVLDGMDAEAIELAADWDDAEGALYTELVALRLIDIVDGVATIHDWAEHNPWVYSAPERSEAARAAANKRWRPGKTDADSMRNACAPHAEGMQSACDPHTLGNAESMRPLQKGNAPLLSSPYLTLPYLSSPSPHANAHVSAREVRGRWDGQVSQAVGERWDAFRAAYPWRNRIEEAAQVWIDTLRDGAEADLAIAALAEQKARHKELQDGGHWVPQWRSAKNWIAGRGWEDEPLQPSLTKRPATRDNSKRSQLAKNRDALATWADD
jgi:hypothetical protein